jgi:hypothetical protein
LTDAISGNAIVKKATRIFVVIGAILLAAPLHAEFGVEHPDEVGVTNPSDFSWRAYREAMDRFPERIGIICHNAYELDKAGDHKDAFMFFSECAERGNPPSMINLAQFYDMGWGVPVSAEQSTAWLRRAAERDYSAAQYEYGLALLRGHGCVRDESQARLWIEKAAAQGDRDAIALMRERFSAPGY